MTELRDTLQRTLGDGYRVERELGGGGMSRVFVARDLALDRDVVVKVLSRESTAGASGERFRREIQVIARLQHPHIVSILSAGTADGALYYVMPFIGGESLRARLAREGPLAVSDAVRILREVLDALAFAHKHGVIHRDIKPENVLVEAGHCVVADFGVAKALRESGTMTSAGVALGTPAYMSPEQATADPSVDHRADLYAVGVLAYELLTGAPPFTGTAQQVITAHLTTPAAPLRERRSDVPDSLSELVDRALAKDPRHRPQSASEMLTALEAVTTPTAASSGRSGAGLAPAAGGRRRWRPLAIGGVVLAAALAAFLLLRDRGPASPITEGADVIAVMPLGAVSDTSLARLGQDLVVTLSTNLDGVGSLRTIDAVTLLMRARKLPSPIPLDDAKRLGQQLGARSILTGTLISEGDRVRASVTLHGVDGGGPLARATALAAPGEIAALTDSLTWAVLAQIWRRGTPPSPVLTGLTTPSIDALRAFLDGERHFQRLAIVEALAAYRRAFELDSNFVQAFLRHDYVTGWVLRPRDPWVHGRLLELADRLPERERLWLQTRELSIPLPDKVQRWEELARRYPDYPPVLMSAADAIIHQGPLYGISIENARPHLERLDLLVPDHADTKFHKTMVAMITGTDSEFIATADEAGRAAVPPWGSVIAWMADVRRAQVAGQPLPPAERAISMTRALAKGVGNDQSFALVAGSIGLHNGGGRYRLEMLEEVRRAGVFSASTRVASSFGEGLLRIGRGDWGGGLTALQRLENTSLEPQVRVTSARLAAIGAWLGAIPATSADSVLSRVRAQLGDDAGPADQTELRWLDGLVGVALGDEARVRAAASDLRSNARAVSVHAARSLDGLWLARTSEERGADSLKAVSDDAMREGGFLMTVEAVNRLVVARAMRRRGTPAEAERYLMWTDAVAPQPRTVSLSGALWTVVGYERGAALDDAGNRDGALRHLRAFVEEYDQPPAAFVGMVDDARQRLARLEKGDAPPAPRPVDRGK